MRKPKKLRRGDKVAVVSLSSGMLGEQEESHVGQRGEKRLHEFGLTPVYMPNALKGIAYLKEHPEARATDLKDAFLDERINGIICAIGGDDTYRLLPYLMEDAEFREAVQKHPKLFTGFSDTTIDHLMLYRLGLQTFYGPNFICDLGELASEMLPYTKEAFGSYFKNDETAQILSSSVWYEERTDFSTAVLDTERVLHPETHGYEVLQGSGVRSGTLLGGCMESLYDVLNGSRYADEQAVCEKYGIFPKPEEWCGKIVFLETCEEQPTPELFRKELTALREHGVFDAAAGVLAGKPQDETYYREYQVIYREVLPKDLPVLFNVNFGHAYPRCVLQYGTRVRVDFDKGTIFRLEPMFQQN